MLSINSLGLLFTAVYKPNSSAGGIWHRALLFIIWFYILLMYLLNWSLYFLQVLLFFSMFSKIFNPWFCDNETPSLSNLNILCISCCCCCSQFLVGVFGGFFWGSCYISATLSILVNSQMLSGVSLRHFHMTPLNIYWYSFHS